MKFIAQSLILGTVLAGTMALQPSSCSARALFEWPGSKKAKAGAQPAAVSEPVQQPAGAVPETMPKPAVVPKPAADPDWPEIDLNTLAQPKEKLSPVKKLWPLARKTKAQNPTTRGGSESSSTAAGTAAVQNSLQQTIKKQDPDWPEIETTTSPSAVAAPPVPQFPQSIPAAASGTDIETDIKTSDLVKENIESSTKTNVQTDTPKPPPATTSNTSSRSVKTKTAATKPQLIPQSTTTSAFKTSAANILAQREVIKAVHIHKTPTTERIIIATDSVFDRDLATITPTGELVLNKLTDFVEQWKDHPVFIECHCDNFGFDTFIRKLTQQRADCIRQWFLKRNLLDEIQVKAVGAGKDKPLVPNQKNGKDDKVGMAINRRLEIYIDKTKAIEVPVIVQEPEIESDMRGQAPPQQSASDADSQNPAGHDPNFGDASLILDKLPRLEDLDPHAGRTRDYTTEKEKMPERDTPEKIREHEWEQKEFGLWREKD